jgi:hypothetical protein
MRKALVAAALSAGLCVGAVGTAAAAPNPNPNAPDHTGTACTSVLTNNPNTQPGGHISATGGSHFSDVGAAMCDL